MKLPQLAIANYRFTFVIFALLIIAGILSFINMPRSEDPMVSEKFCWAVVIYPGATPLDLEELVIDPLEEALNELDDIKKISSSAREGFAIVQVDFHNEVVIDDTYSDFVDKVNSVRSDMPDEIYSLKTYKATISDFVNIVQIALYSDKADYNSLNEEAEILKKELEKIAGIKKVEVQAVPEREVRISMNQEKMAELGIPFTLIINAVAANNANIPGGSIDIGSKIFSIQTSGSYKSLDEIRETIIHSAEGKTIYLKDIAEVHYDYEDESYTARYRDKKAVFVTATQKEATNIFDIMEQVYTRYDDFRAELDEKIQTDIVFDQAESVSDRLNNFFGNLLQGMFLVGLVMLFVLGLRGSIIIMLVIPVSILIGISALDLSGYGLQQISIAGLVIALGMLVDNAIVVMENVARFLRKGYDPEEAAVKSTSQIGWAVISSTATTVLAFVPIMMMGDVTGEFIRGLPFTVVFTLLASLLLSLTVTPYLSSKFIKVRDKDYRAAKFLNRIIDNSYADTLRYALRHPAVVITLALFIFLGCLALFPLIGVSFFPKAEKPYIFVNINAPEGTHLDRTDSLTYIIEDEIKKVEGIERYTVNVGHSNPRVYYNSFGKERASEHAQFLIKFRENDQEYISATVRSFREKFKDFTFAKIEVKELEQGPPVEAPIAIKIIGENLERIKNVSDDIEEFFIEEPGVININNPLSEAKTDLFIRINREKAGIYGVPLVSIDRAVRAAVAGIIIGSFRNTEGNQYNIVLRSPEGEEIALEDLDNIYVPSLGGAMIPLRQLASVEFKATPLQIHHFNLDRSNTISADVISGYSVDEATKNIVAKMNDYRWPDGSDYYVAGELEKREESFGGMTEAALIAVIAIFAVLILQFKSYTQPFIIFSAIPLAIAGSFIALFITGLTFSFTAFIGFTSLIGIVVNNSIILVDYTNQLLEENRTLEEAVTEAAKTRFIPILLTTFTTIGGLIPLTVAGGTMWAPMGWTIIGGLLSSAFLTLIVTPVLYKLLTGRKREMNTVKA